MEDSSQWGIVIESDGERLAVGPVVAWPGEACLSCVAARRSASAIPVGTLSIHQLSSIEYERIKDSRLCRNQIHPVNGAQRFVPPNSCPRSCPTVRLQQSETPLPVEECIGDRIGLVQRVEVMELIPGAFTAIAFGARNLGSGGIAATCSGTATSHRREHAKRLALYEALERYAAAFWDPRQLSDVDAMDGPRVEMNILDTGQCTMVAARKVFMPFPDNSGQWSGSSEGLACGTSVQDALGRALSELIERRFLAKLFEAPMADRYDTGLASCGERCFVVEYTDGHFIAISVAWSSVPPYVIAGFGCAIEKTAAIDKANRERLHIQAHQLLALSGYWGDSHTSSSPLDLVLELLASTADFASEFLARVVQAADRFEASAKAETSDPSPTAWRDMTPPDVGAFGVAVVRAVHL